MSPPPLLAGLTGRRSFLLALVCASALTIVACSDTGSPQPATPAVATATRTAASAGSGANATTVRPSTPPVRVTLAATERPTRVASGSPVPTLLPNTARERIFDEVWQTVHDRYLYSDYHGADWDGLRTEYRPRVLGAADADEFYGLLSEMVEMLGDEHSRYISPEAAKEEDDLQRGENSYVGVGVLSTYEEDAALILLVFPDSPAEEGGLQRRDRITHVDGVPFDPENNTIRGPDGSQVRLTVKSPGQPARDVTLTRHPVVGKISAWSKRLTDTPEIGYLVVPSLWAEDMADQVEAELSSLLDGPRLRGLILDLRANEGGWRTVLTGILGQFVRGYVGDFYSQEDEYPLRIDQGSLYGNLENVPLVVLVDADSQSYAEVLPAVLQSSGRAQVVGVKTAGNTETNYQYNFEDGSRLWLAQEGFRLPDGTNLEGRGVLPDVALDVDWIDYPEPDDPHIVQALQLLGVR